MFISSKERRILLIAGGIVGASITLSFTPGLLAESFLVIMGVFFVGAMWGFILSIIADIFDSFNNF